MVCRSKYERTKCRRREKDDEKINDVAKEVCEKVIDHIDDSLLVADQDFHTEIEQVLHENQQKQLKTLQNIETILIQKKYCICD